MMIVLFLILSSFIPSIESCVPTPSTTTPAPITCSSLCSPSSLVVASPIDDQPSTVNGCAVRTFVCIAPPLFINAVITYNGSNMIFDDGTGTARMVVTCNAAGTAWTYMGTPVTSASCALF